MTNRKSHKSFILLGFTAAVSAAIALVTLSVNSKYPPVDATDLIVSSIKFEKGTDNWSRKSGVGYFTYATSSSLHGGDVLYAYSTNSGYTETGISSMKNGDGPLIFTSDDKGTTPYQFQNITAVKVVFESTNVNFNVMTSKNNASYTDHDCFTGAFSDNYTLNDISTRYVKITVTDSSEKAIKSVQLFYSCSYNYSDDPVVDEVVLNKSETSIVKGYTETLVATVNGSGDYDETVSWASSNISVATVSNAGVVTAVSAGSATITATSNGDNTKSASCAVTVIEDSGDPIILSGIYSTSVSSYNAFIDFDLKKYYFDGGSTSVDYFLYEIAANGDMTFSVDTSKENSDISGTTRRLFYDLSTPNTTGKYTEAADSFTISLYYNFGGEKSTTYTFTKVS